MFFRQMTDAFFVLTDPASNMRKPAHIHMTSAPQSRNEKELRTNEGLARDCSHKRQSDERTDDEKAEPQNISV